MHWPPPHASAIRPLISGSTPESGSPFNSFVGSGMRSGEPGASGPERCGRPPGTAGPPGASGPRDVSGAPDRGSDGGPPGASGECGEVRGAPDGARDDGAPEEVEDGPWAVAGKAGVSSAEGAPP